MSGGGGQLTRFFGGTRALTQATVHHFLSLEVTAGSLDMKPDEKSNAVPPENTKSAGAVRGRPIIA